MSGDEQQGVRSSEDAVADSVRSAAHELLEPLVMAEVYVTLVHDRLDPLAHSDSRADLQATGRVLSRARIVVEALLLDAVEPDRELVARPVSLARLAADCVTLLGAEISARKATVRVGPLPTVNGDEALLGAVLKNLLVNGLKYGRPSGGTIELSAERLGDVWRVAVATRGPAVSEKDRDVIFLPYRRGPGRERMRGAGLGLAASRRLVERHGGHLDVTAIPAWGNVFFFTLPA